MDNLNINIEPKFVEYEDGEGGVGMVNKNVLSFSVDGLVTMEDWEGVKNKIDSIMGVLNIGGNNRNKDVVVNVDNNMEPFPLPHITKNTRVR